MSHLYHGDYKVGTSNDEKRFQEIRADTLAICLADDPMAMGRFLTKLTGKSSAFDNAEVSQYIPHLPMQIRLDLLNMVGNAELAMRNGESQIRMNSRLDNSPAKAYLDTVDSIVADVFKNPSFAEGNGYGRVIANSAVSRGWGISL